MRFEILPYLAALAAAAAAAAGLTPAKGTTHKNGLSHGLSCDSRQGLPGDLQDPQAEQTCLSLALRCCQY